MTTIRTPNVSDRRGFSMPRSTAQDGKRSGGGISFEARGVLAYLLSKPDDWIIQIADLMAEGGIGRDKVKNILKELRDALYLATEIQHDDQGRITGKTYQLYESVNHTTEKASYGSVAATENPSDGDHKPEKPSDGKTIGRQTRRIHNTESLQKTEEKNTEKIAAAKTAAAAPRSAPPSINSPSEPATLPPTTKSKKQKSEPPAAPDDPKKQRDAALVDLIAAWKDSTGDLNPNAYANKTIRAGAGAMVDAGITVQDVTAYLDGLMYDDWWSSRAVPFSHVVSNIQAWKRENEIYAPVNYEVPKPDLPETDLTWEELRAMGEELKKTLAERNSLQAVIARADAEYQSPFDRLREDMIARGEL